jgi:alcohol dehydrogenase
LFPRFALVDPELTWTVPKLVTAQTGFDALAHAIESYVSPKRAPIHDELALHAMRIVSTYLPIALEHPEHQQAREQLAYASTTMGMNLACVGTCFPHRVDKSLCGLRPDIAHGQSVALFYPHWIDSCFRSETKRFARIAAILRPEVSDLPLEEAASMCSQIVTDWILSIGLKLGLNRFLTDDDLPKLVAGVGGDLSVNPVAIRRADLHQTLQKIFLEDYS